MVGVDPEGSIFTAESAEWDVHQYLVEGVGEDFWPVTFDRDVVDEIVMVERCSTPSPLTRRLASYSRVCWSVAPAGWLPKGALGVAERLSRQTGGGDLPPLLGRGYLSKLFNDRWLEEHGMGTSDVSWRCVRLTPGKEPDPTTGAVVVPIDATSTYAQAGAG